MRKGLGAADGLRPADRSAVLHYKACVCLHKLQEWQESPVLLPELDSRVGFAHTPNDAKLVNNWASCCNSRYQQSLSTQGGTDPKSHSSSLVPTHFWSWEARDVPPRAGIPAKLHPVMAVLP